MAEARRAGHALVLVPFIVRRADVAIFVHCVVSALIDNFLREVLVVSLVALCAALSALFKALCDSINYQLAWLLFSVIEPLLVRFAGNPIDTFILIAIEPMATIGITSTLAVVVEIEFKYFIPLPLFVAICFNSCCDVRLPDDVADFGGGF